MTFHDMIVFVDGDSISINSSPLEIMNKIMSHVMGRAACIHSMGHMTRK